MARISTMATSALANHLIGEAGLPEKVGQLVLTSAQQIPQISASDILERHVAAEVAEKTSGVRYPDRLRVLREGRQRSSGEIPDVLGNSRLERRHPCIA